MPLSIHHNVIYYIHFRKDTVDTNKLDKMFAQCTLSWTNIKAPHYDAVMVQKYKQANDSLYGNKVGRLCLLFTIQNTKQLDSEGKYPKYVGVLVKTL